MNDQARKPPNGAQDRRLGGTREKVRTDGEPMLIIMAGLPGTGKSTIAARCKRLSALWFSNKDVVRSVLFPAPVLDYSTAQDEVCMNAIYQAAAVILRKLPRQAVIIDGRTFLRAYQIRDVLRAGRLAQNLPRISSNACAKTRLPRRGWSAT